MKLKDLKVVYSDETNEKVPIGINDYRLKLHDSLSVMNSSEDVYTITLDSFGYRNSPIYTISIREKGKKYSTHIQGLKDIDWENMELIEIAQNSAYHTGRCWFEITDIICYNSQHNIFGYKQEKTSEGYYCSGYTSTPTESIFTDCGLDLAVKYMRSGDSSD